jgi:lipopolysaccharide/colanic/teichoic acid biosynthesis glycosyltransferase
MADILFSVLFLVLAFPAYIAVALLVRISSPGPILYRQERLGANGRIFWCYKFRSMVVDADAILNLDPELKKQFRENFKLKNDPRITPIGGFLRRTSLDELPQFWNVLRGEMTLIGPRPIVPAELVKYGRFDRKLLSVKPGLSGLWQALGRSDTSYPERVAMDMLYIDNRSLLLDIKLMFMTVASVIRKTGAR